MKTPTMLWDYIKERENKEIVETDFGFALYEVDKNVIYLSDIYVVPEQRNAKKVYEIADIVTTIGRERNCNILMGSIDPKLDTADRSRKVLSNYGYVFVGHNSGLDWYKKEI